jgi:hypothetical protein
MANSESPLVDSRNAQAGAQNWNAWIRLGLDTGECIPPLTSLIPG